MLQYSTSPGLFRVVLSLVLVAVLNGAFCAHAESAPAKSKSPQPTAIPAVPSVEIWDQLASKKGKKILGRPVDIAGFSIVNEFDNGNITEFMLTRYPGGCVHVPLPPPSNMVHVVMEDGKSTPSFFGKRVIIHGVIHEGQRIDAGFEMKAASVKEFPF